jgi:hypothetical protein
MSEVGNKVEDVEKARIACPNCGKPCRVGSNYCWHCGHSFGETAGPEGAARGTQTGDAAGTDVKTWSSADVQRALDDPSTGRDWLMNALKEFSGLDDEGIRAWGGATRQQLVDAIKKRMEGKPIEPPTEAP